jgi:hypothetical protein
LERSWQAGQPPGDHSRSTKLAARWWPAGLQELGAPVAPLTYPAERSGTRANIALNA